MKNRSKSAAGFTLLELLLAMSLMAFLSVMTMQSIQRALKTKAKLQKNIDLQSSIRDALRVMERDIQLAFHYRLYGASLQSSAPTNFVGIW